MNYELFIGTPQENIQFDIFEINGGSYRPDFSDFRANVQIHSSFIDVNAYGYLAYADGLLRFYDQLKTCYATL